MNRGKQLILILFMLFTLVSQHDIAKAYEMNTNLQNETTLEGVVSFTNDPLYIADVPKEISFGEVSETNYISEYAINIDFVNEEHGDVFIQSANSLQIQDNNKAITVFNTLRNSALSTSRSFNSMLWIEPENVRTLQQGNYLGSIDFSFTYLENEVVDHTKGSITSHKNIGTITNGFNTLIKNNTTDDFHEFSIEVKDYESKLKNAIDTSAFLKSYTLSLTKTTSEGVEKIKEIDHVMEVRIQVDELKSLTHEYKILSAEGEVYTPLQKLEARPIGEQSYEAGQYFVGIDCIYLYVSTMQEYVLSTRVVADGIYPPTLEVLPDIPTTDNDNNSNGNVENNGNSNGNNGSDTIVPLPNLEAADKDSDDGQYTADVSIRKFTDITSLSMCDGLFYSQADIVIDGDNALITMYVIDPIPLYASEGTPLSNIVFTYKGKEYKASVETNNQVAKYFNIASGFINEAGNYYTSKVTVTLPKAAISDSLNGDLLCEAYVNAVMNITQEFYVLFGNLSKGETSSTTSKDDIIDVNNSQSSNNNSNSLNSDGSSDEENEEVKGSFVQKVMNLVINSTLVKVIIGIIISALLGIFAYAYYLKRKREQEDV